MTTCPTIRLDVEDSDVLPLFERHYTGARFDAVQGRAVADARKQGMAFYIPWIMAAIEPDVRARLIAEAPLPMRLFWRATRRRHAKLAHAALGGTDLPSGATARL